MNTSSQNKRADARQRWTTEHQQQAEELHAQGLSYRAIGRELGFSHATVRCRLDLAAHEKALEQKRRHHAANREEAKKKSREWYWANTEKARRYARDYYWANWDECRKRADQWRRSNLKRYRDLRRRWEARNPEKVRESRRRGNQKWREQNPEKVKEIRKLWRQANLEKCREANRRQGAMRRACRRRSIMMLSSIGKAERFAIFNNCCAYCGRNQSLSVDHVLALSAGGLDQIDNIVPACRTCNSSKQASSVEEWYRRQPFFTNARWQKIQRHCPAATIGQLPLAFDSASAA